MSTCCSIVHCNEEKDKIVGTSTSCSASCESRTAVRIGTSKGRILGTSITAQDQVKAHERIAQCLATVPPSAAQEHQEFAPREQSARRSTSCRWTRVCQPATSGRGAGGPGGEALPERGRVVLRVPLSQPLPSSDRRGASARDASSSGGVALSGGGHSKCRRLLRRVQPSTTKPPARAKKHR